MGDDRIESNISRTRAEIASISRAAGRSGEPLLVAVSKTVDLPEVGAAIGCGIHDFGENRAQELVRKHTAFPDENWHFIGRIQTNKLKDVVGRACLIHSVASTRALDKIDALARRLGIVQDVLLEVNVSGEQSKDGFALGELEDALRHAQGLSGLRVRGLMTMAPQGDLATARSVFSTLRDTRDKLKVIFDGSPNVELVELSMGMSQDHPAAIEEGATIVRLGHSIFA